MTNNLWSKYLYTPLYLFLIFISACSSPNPVPQENKYQEETFQENQENQAKKAAEPKSKKPASSEFDTSKAETNEFKLAPHWQLSYVDEPVFNSKVAVLETGSSNNPTIVLIHGLGDLGMKDWFGIIPALEENYHVIAMDLPGFGFSSGVSGRFLPTNYAHTVAAIIKQYTNQDVIVIGHSMGGAVALRYTELYQESVKQLVLVDVAGLLEKSAFIKHIATFEFGDEISTPMKLLMGGVNDISSSVIEVGTKSTFISDFLQSNDYAWDLVVSDSSNMNAALSLVEEDFNHAVNHITVPVNIIWGEKDSIAPLRTGKVLNKKMQHVRLQVINDAGHVPMKSHYQEFMQSLNIALNKPITNKFSLPYTGKSQGVLICRKESHQTYSGHYDEIIIEGCNEITLKDISTDKLLIKGSVVSIDNFSFSHRDNRIELNESIVSITNADLSGNNIMGISGSRVDMAGVSFKAMGDAVMIENGSRISASFCDIDSPKYKGVVHGVFHLSRQALVE